LSPPKQHTKTPVDPTRFQLDRRLHSASPPCPCFGVVGIISLGLYFYSYLVVPDLTFRPRSNNLSTSSMHMVQFPGGVWHGEASYFEPPYFAPPSLFCLSPPPAAILTFIARFSSILVTQSLIFSFEFVTVLPPIICTIGISDAIVTEQHVSHRKLSWEPFQLKFFLLSWLIHCDKMPHELACTLVNIG
jgi:hypothetical protein